MRRAQWSALGLTDEDLEKPKIAIVNSSSQLASCFSHLDEIVAPLKAAIEAAGGVAFEVRTAAAGGPLGLVRDGDMISIDVNAKRIDLEVDADELDRRRAELPPLAAPAGCGWLSVYARTVAPLGRGATLGGIASTKS